MATTTRWDESSRTASRQTHSAETDESDAYIQKVIAAGGFGRYERAHLNAIAAIFVPEFAHRSLPPEIVRRVVEYAFHVGDY